MIGEEQVIKVLHFTPVEDLNLFEYPGLTYFRNQYGEIVVKDDTDFFVVGKRRELIPAKSIEEMENILDRLRK